MNQKQQRSLTMYGVFEENKTIHIIPVDDNEQPKDPHVVDEFCICGPDIKEVNGCLLVTHQNEN